MSGALQWVKAAFYWLGLRFLSLIWYSALFVGVVCLSLKIAVAFSHVYAVHHTLFGEEGLGVIAHVLILFVLMYLLFIWEGMILAAIQLKAKDKAKGLEAIGADPKLGGSGSKVAKILIRVHDDYRAVITGRQVLAIVIVVGIVFAIQMFDYGANPQDMDWLPISLATRTDIIAWLQNPYIVFLISVALPGWICQLLPQFMAEGRSLAFARLPGALMFVRLSIAISHLRAGQPSERLLGAIQRLRFFDEQVVDRIGVGDADAFRAMSHNFGHNIQKREVRVLPEETRTVISDKTVYEFADTPTRDIFHAVKVYDPEAEVAGSWDFDSRDGIVMSEPLNYIYNFGQGQSRYARVEVAERDASLRPGTPLSQPVGKAVEDIVDAIERRGRIFLAVVPLADALPAGGGASSFGLAVSYTAEAIDTDDFVANEFEFEISKPTAALTIEILKPPGNTFLRTPTVWKVDREDFELSADPSRTEMSEARAPRVRTESGYLVSVPYPPVGSCIIVGVDARIAAMSEPSRGVVA